MVGVAQLVRALDCDSGGRGFEPHHPPHLNILFILFSEIFLISNHLSPINS